LHCHLSAALLERQQVDCLLCGCSVAGKTPSEAQSTAAETDESSYAPSALTYNSMDPMEKSELAAAAMVRGCCAQGWGWGWGWGWGHEEGG
jgi:hypothetical protein